MLGYADEAAAGFERSRAVFDAVVAELADPECAQVTHAELEERLTERSRELMRQLFQDHVDVRAVREERRTGVVGADLWGSRTPLRVLIWGFYAARSYSLMRPPRTGRRLIRFRERSATGWSGRGRLELAAAMGAPSVVVGLILGQDQQQMPLAEDQHPVGNLGPGGEHEPFRMSVRARAARRDPYGLDPGIGQDCVKRYGELPGPVADKEPEARGAITQIHQQVADLLYCPRPVRIRGHAEEVHVAAADLHDEQAVQAPEGHRAVHVEKKSVASIVDACACRNCRHVASVCRWRPGGGASAGRCRA